MKTTALALIGLLLASTAAFADTVYDNSALVDTYAFPFGSPNTSTYGEIFAAPSFNSTLESFSLFLNASDDSGDLQGYIGTWTGSGVGTILYTSALTAVTGSAQEFTFDPDISLSAGVEYIAFLSIAGPEYSSFNNTTTMPGVAAAGSIPGGSYAYINNGGDTSQFTTPDWSTSYPGSPADVEFEADFAPASTPEPSSLMLLGTGLAAVAGAARRKLRA